MNRNENRRVQSSLVDMLLEEHFGEPAVDQSARESAAPQRRLLAGPSLRTHRLAAAALALVGIGVVVAVATLRRGEIDGGRTADGGGFATRGGARQDPAPQDPAPRGSGSEDAPLFSMPWFDDFDTAAASARESGKDVIVFHYFPRNEHAFASDTAYLERMIPRTMRSEDFANGIADKYVLVVFIGSSALAADKSDPERYLELYHRFINCGAPAVLVADADANPLAKIDIYGGAGPDGLPKSKTSAEFIRDVRLASSEGRRLFRAVAKAVRDYEAAASAVGQADGELVLERLAEGVLDLFQETRGSIHRERLLPIMLQVINSENVVLRDRAVLALLRMYCVPPQAIVKAEEIDPENEKGMLDLTTNASMRVGISNESVEHFLGRVDRLLEKGAKDQSILEAVLAKAAELALDVMRDRKRAIGYARQLEGLVDDPAAYARLLDRVLGN